MCWNLLLSVGTVDSTHRGWFYMQQGQSFHLNSMSHHLFYWNLGNLQTYLLVWQRLCLLNPRWSLLSLLSSPWHWNFMCLEGIFFTSFDHFYLSFVVCVAGINVTSAFSFHMEPCRLMHTNQWSLLQSTHWQLQKILLHCRCNHLMRNSLFTSPRVHCFPWLPDQPPDVCLDILSFSPLCKPHSTHMLPVLPMTSPSHSVSNNIHHFHADVLALSNSCK